MKKIFLTLLVAMFAFAATAQEFPYSKILKYNKRDFREAKFKYDEDNNSWHLNHSRGLQATVNVLSAIAGAEADIRPDKMDYSIVAQMNYDDDIAILHVKFYNDETYHKLLTFARDNGADQLDTNSGKLSKLQFRYGGYDMSLQMKVISVSRTTSRTAAMNSVKTLDESYNAYEFVVYTGLDPESPYIDRQERKQAKRDAKGKKKRNVEDLM